MSAGWSERSGTRESLTVQVRTQAATGTFEKFTPTWGTDTTVGHEGTVTGSLLDASDREREVAEARGDRADKVLFTRYPVGLEAAQHRVQTSAGTNYRVISTQESKRRGLYVLQEDTS